MRSAYLVAAIALGALAASVAAQRPPDFASIAYVEGMAYLDDQIVTTETARRPISGSAAIRTAAGRVAVALKRGGTLLLGENTSAQVEANGVYNFNRITILTGSAIVASGTSAPTVTCKGDVRLSSAGVFRFDVLPVDRYNQALCRFRVFEGGAALQLTSLLEAMRPGQSKTLPAGDMIPTMEFAVGELDEFDRWSRQHLAAATSR